MIIRNTVVLLLVSCLCNTGNGSVIYDGGGFHELDYPIPIGSSVIYDDGGFHELDYEVPRNRTEGVQVYDSESGDITTLTVSDGANVVSGFLGAFDNSHVTVQGGVIAWGLVADDHSTIDVAGGDMGWVAASSEGKVTITGGTMGWIEVYESGVIEIYGTDFNYGYGELTELNGLLTGILATGEVLNSRFWRGDEEENILPGSIVLIPEPATVLLLGIGAVLLRRRRRV